MIRSKVLFPDPLGPMTPIFAPGRKDKDMARSTSLPVEVTFRKPTVVKTNSTDMRPSLSLPSPAVN
jgi:hypothetical protein